MNCTRGAVPRSRREGELADRRLPAIRTLVRDYGDSVPLIAL